LVILALLSNFFSPDPIPPTPTSGIFSSATSAPSFTPEPDTPTPMPTVTLTITATPDPTATHSLTPTQLTITPSATNPPFRSIELCVQVEQDVNNINVRAGPSSTLYAVLGQVPVDTCLLFSAFHVNTIDERWLLIANAQTNPELSQFAGGWIRANLLGLESTDPIPLPLVTLTPTPTPSETPSITPTFTRSPTPTLTDTLTPTATETPTETATPTETTTP
jgi:hypothetical protein